MAEESAISWTDSTWNGWVGCEKIGPACDHCYAELWAKRAGRAGLWEGKREMTKTWHDPLRWERQHPEFFASHGRRRRVFAFSLADFLDNAVPKEWSIEAWGVVMNCPHLEWYIVSKRIPNLEKMLPPFWDAEHFGHIVLIATVINQTEYDRDSVRLKALKAKYPWLRVGLSCEPLLGPINLGICRWLDWVIVGGESGAHARYFSMAWAINMAHDCHLSDVPFHFKQVGNNPDGWPYPYTGKGDKPSEWPLILRDQQFPRLGA